MPGWAVVWLAPVPRARGPVGAEHDQWHVGVMGLEGGRVEFATAVPEVVTTTAGTRVTLASPRARKPAERSSTRMEAKPPGAVGVLQGDQRRRPGPRAQRRLAHRSG